VIEVVHPGATAGNAKAVIFDFDGTLSLIRSGWMDVMVPLCVEQLSTLDTNESPEQLRGIVEEFVWRLTGKETIYQMMALADAIRGRGGHPLTPLEYKKMYLDRLWLNISHRVEGLRSGLLEPDRFLVPGARSLLENLTDRGLLLYLASGTDDANVKEEAGLLGIASFFKGHIYGAQDDLSSFSKALLVQRILSKTSVVRPDELVVFGDGYVEIEEVAKAGGVTVGVASSEPECLTVDSWKRERLIRAGADFIVPNFLQLTELLGAVLQSPALAAID
jgi:phosphoglycolate phosphatase-like HAD superfamily hydrolase